MGLLDFLKGPDINQGVKECGQTRGAILLDVRTPQEYQGGHIPGSKNVPLQTLGGGDPVSAAKDAPLFVYCYSGGRSRQAAGLLARMGYVNVKNIGGIAAYTGRMEH